MGLNWTETFDDDDNSVWEAPSPYHDDGPLWRGLMQCVNCGNEIAAPHDDVCPWCVGKNSAKRERMARYAAKVRKRKPRKRDTKPCQRRLCRVRNTKQERTT